jgi:hypothetical protein
MKNLFGEHQPEIKPTRVRFQISDGTGEDLAGVGIIMPPTANHEKCVMDEYLTRIKINLAECFYCTEHGVTSEDLTNVDLSGWFDQSILEIDSGETFVFCLESEFEVLP